MGLRVGFWVPAIDVFGFLGVLCTDGFVALVLVMVGWFWQ